jgi:hypothetical protein
MAPLTAAAHDHAKTIAVDFMFLDLNSCTRCVGTDRNLEAALGAVRQIVEQTGVQVEVRKHLVDSEETARRLRLVSSPTIRVNGNDIALELKESSCSDEACTDGCGADIDCRMWTHHGEDSTQAPVGLIVDAVLREIYAPRAGTGLQAYELPDNLRRLFGSKAQASRPAAPDESMTTGRMAGVP